jgi:indoleamine 2,3-dioxygenase
MKPYNQIHGDILYTRQVSRSNFTKTVSTLPKLPVIPIDGLERSEFALRRAHHVLAWIMHFYIHTLPPNADVRIPAPVTIPLLQICNQLQLPPVLTYSDNVLYNWTMKTADLIPTVDNIQCQTLFTGTSDEAEFYLCSARIELRGVEALELMRATMDETFVGDHIAVRRITSYLNQMSTAIGELTKLLLSVRDGCDPDVFSRDIRPWFRGADADPRKRKWLFEGLEHDPELQEPTELSGASAGQSSLIHALDTFLGVHMYSHSSTTSGGETKPSFLSRMQLYMPRHHRGFLTHLAANRRPLRSFVTSSEDTKLLDAYNSAVLSLKGFRDAHMRIVSLYILGPGRRLRAREQGWDSAKINEPMKGTGGTDMVTFLKDIRDRTAGATMMSG